MADWSNRAQAGARNALRGMLASSQERGQRAYELRNLDAQELNRMADDMGLSAKELQHPVARGPSASDLLYR